MRFLAVHPSPLMYTKIYLRLEPLGLELLGAAAPPTPSHQGISGKRLPLLPGK